MDFFVFEYGSLSPQFYIMPIPYVLILWHVFAFLCYLSKGADLPERLKC